MQRREWHSKLYGKHAGPVVCTVGDIEVIDCEVCGFKHIVPLPTPEELQAFYEEEFYQSEKTNYLDEAHEDFAWKKVELSLRFEVAETLLTTSSKRLLDIGSGPGDFLAVGKELGWDCVGVEPSEVASSHAKSRGLTVHNAFFDQDLAQDLGSFDFIHMSEVLEHVAQPKPLVELAYSLLKPGGVMCVSTPNDFNPLQATVTHEFKKDDWWVVPDHHLNYFDFDSLERLLQTSGLSIEKRLTNFPMELFLLMGQDYTQIPSKGRELHGWRKNMDIALSKQSETMEAFYSAMANAGFGRLAIAFASKPGA